MSFAITSALASEYNARILLRIDDFDRDRTNPQFIKDIFETFAFLGIEWHAGPLDVAGYESTFSQIHRTQLYNSALQQLREAGKIYACTCSRVQVIKADAEGTYKGTCRHKNIPLDAPGVCWRINTEEAGPLSVNTQKGIVLADFPHNMRDFIVKRKDGFPAYQLISVVDDTFFGVDLIVRGDDLFPSTLAQLYLAAQLGNTTLAKAMFYHHHLLVDEEGKKMSKSAGSTSVHYLRQQGCTPQDIFFRIAQMAGENVRPAGWQQLCAILQT
jgi:glutamyl-tRNA synthetase